MLSDKEKKRRQHEKELNSLRNKMGSNIVWFDALNKTQQYDLLFMWKKEKKRNNLTKPQKKKIRKRVGTFVKGGYKILTQEVETISYPANFKHFLESVKGSFRIDKKRMRESQLKHLLK